MTKNFLFIFASVLILFSCDKKTIEGPAPVNQNISGKVSCEINTNKGLSGITVELIQNGIILETTKTDKEGSYLLTKAVEGLDYEVKLSADDTTLGVSTLDLVLMSKAIDNSNNGLIVYTDFQKLALDIDLNGVLNKADQEMFKSLLLLQTPDPNLVVWRFATKDYEFPSDKNPKGAGFVNTAKVKIKNSPESLNFIGTRFADVDRRITCG